MRVEGDGIVATKRSERSKRSQVATNIRKAMEVSGTGWGFRVFLLNIVQEVSWQDKIDVSPLLPVVVFVGDVGHFQLRVPENFTLDRHIPLPGVRHLVGGGLADIRNAEAC